MLNRDHKEKQNITLGTAVSILAPWVGEHNFFFSY